MCYPVGFVAFDTLPRTCEVLENNFACDVVWAFQLEEVNTSRITSVCSVAPHDLY